LRYSKILQSFFIFSILAGCQSTEKKTDLTVRYQTPCEHDFIEMDKDKNQKPIVRIEPKYPRHAAKNKLSGYVKLVFDITKEGKPINIYVVESYPNETFVQASVNALSKWRYTAKARKCLPLRLGFEMGPKPN
jgi:TonB family protein